MTEAGRDGSLDIDPGTRLVLSIDQGTSATKAVVVDEHGVIRRRASTPLAQQFPQPGWAEQDPMEIWASVQQAVQNCLADVDPAQVVATGLSTQRESTLLWDRATGRPLGPVLGWQDTRGAALCARLRAAGHADRVRQRRRAAHLCRCRSFGSAEPASPGRLEREVQRLPRRARDDHRLEHEGQCLPRRRAQHGRGLRALP